MEAYWCHAVQKQRHKLTLLEDLQLLWKTYKSFWRLITKDLITAPEHLSSAPEHFRNCTIALTDCSGTRISATEG